MPCWSCSYFHHGCGDSYKTYLIPYNHCSQFLLDCSFLFFFS
uniref:Uncharacterized protein n=1 Tax=Rhizophora mucronata TaxID=61149 RepID=A0A2P2PF28_RHIMU